MSAKSVVVSLLACFAAGAQAQDDSRLRELVAQLGAEDASSRDAAQAELERLGAADDTGAVERLVADAVKSSDPEVSARARAALRSVRYWDNIVVVGGAWGARAIDLQEGTIPWTRPGRCNAWVGPRHRGARAYIAPEAGGLECVDLKTGVTVWTLHGHPRGLAVGVSTWIGIEDGVLLCVDLGTGDVRWIRSRSPRYAAFELLEVASLGRTLYVRTSGGLSAFDAMTGEEVWSVRGSILLFRCVPGAVYAMVELDSFHRVLRRHAPDSGAVVWETGCCSVRMEVATDPAGDSDVVLLDSASDLREVALDSRTGRVAWEWKAGSLPFHFEPGGRFAWNAQPRPDGQETAVCRIDLRTGASEVRQSLPLPVAVATSDGDRVVVVCLRETWHSWGGREASLSLRAFDADLGHELWTMGPEAIGNGDFAAKLHFEWLGSNLLVYTTSPAAILMRLIDPATGEVLARQVLAR